jgi:hypothetical protein
MMTWLKVTTRCQVSWRDTSPFCANTRSQQARSLYVLHNSSGDANCPEFVKRAKRFVREIENKDDQYDSAGSSDDDEDDEIQGDQQEDEEPQEDQQEDEEPIIVDPKTTTRPSFDVESLDPDASSTTLDLNAHTGWNDEEEEIVVEPRVRKSRKRSSSSSGSQEEMSATKRFRTSKSRLGTVMSSGDDFLTENSPVAKVYYFLGNVELEEAET